ncbi:hypothetical protein D3C83_13570 [compost metagenome]
MSALVTGRRKARRATVDRMRSAQAGSSAAVRGMQTNRRSRDGDAVTPVGL